MIQQEYKNNIADIGGDVAQTGFTIEANASVYAMLTQNVYNDPILAVIREWSTNACDACLAANVPVEYDVHLPTLSEPQFYVRDYGTGLPPEDIIGLFSNLGASTKRDSNLYNGTLGIGRMAGLAVADAFTVESYHQGTLYSYVISMQDGIPVTLHLGNSATDERDGLKLGVTVESRSFGYYREKANNLFKYFDHKPNINDPAIILELDTEERISDDWFILKNTDRYDYDNYLVMSQVLYKIPRDSAINTQDFRRLVLKAPSGAVTFNPGRESLSLDKKTISYVNQAFEQVKDDYVTAGTTALAACESDKELIQCYTNITKDAPSRIAGAIKPTPFMSHELQQLTHSSYGNNYQVYESSEFRTDTLDQVRLFSKATYYKTARALDSRNTLALHTFFNANHVIVDLKTKFKAALNQHYQNELVVFWQREKTADIDEAIKESKRYLDSMGISYELASSIVAKMPTTGSSSAAREGLYTSHIGYGGKVFKSTSMPTDQITAQKYLYLPLKHTTPIIKDDTFSFEDYYCLYRYLDKVMDVPPIKGVAKKYQDYVEELENWIDFETFIKETVPTLTFRCDAKTITTQLSSHLNDDEIKHYPTKIREYYQNIQAYRDFCVADNYVAPGDTKDLLLRLNATKEEFTPPNTTTKAEIEARFPLAYKPLFYNYGYSQYQRDELIRLAKIEDFYAIHSSEQ